MMISLLAPGSGCAQTHSSSVATVGASLYTAMMIDTFTIFLKATAPVPK
jgi:hypothetical protein